MTELQLSTAPYQAPASLPRDRGVRLSLRRAVRVAGAVLVLAVAATTAATATAPGRAEASYSLLLRGWALDRINQRTLPMDGNFDRDPLYGESGAGVTVYVIDYGIRTTHNEFSGRATVGYNVSSNASDSDTQCFAHGTEVASLIAGSSLGVAPQAKIVSVRVSDKNCYDASPNIAKAIDWVIANRSGPSVISMSLGHWGESDLQHWEGVDEAAQRAVAAGITFVTAAGNVQQDACRDHPADVPGVITVASTTSADNFDASYSNYGPCVDILAPGTNVRVAGNTSDDEYTWSSGTSMAAPLVAGAAALYLQSSPTASPAEVLRVLSDSATDGVVNSVSGTTKKLLYTNVAPSVILYPRPVPTLAPYQSVTIDAGLDVSIDNSWYMVKIYNVATGAVVQDCVSGSDCYYTVPGQPSGTSQTYVACVARGFPHFMYPYNLNYSKQVTINWS